MCVGRFMCGCVTRVVAAATRRRMMMCVFVCVCDVVLEAQGKEGEKLGGSFTRRARSIRGTCVMCWLC